MWVQELVQEGPLRMGHYETTMMWSMGQVKGVAMVGLAKYNTMTSYQRSTPNRPNRMDHRMGRWNLACLQSVARTHQHVRWMVLFGLMKKTEIHAPKAFHRVHRKRGHLNW